ncbi:hypothetical protein BKA69DRAFT_1065722 [Paraphysoderma sedebokerense]|nr:hypothetical protein BKA69DRAFT_1065722 [Paraphysoderma sedebokerense]
MAANADTKNRLHKKILSVKTADNRKFHLVSYYTPQDVADGTLPPASSVSWLSDVKVPMKYYTPKLNGPSFVDSPVIYGSRIDDQSTTYPDIKTNRDQASLPSRTRDTPVVSHPDSRVIPNSRLSSGPDGPNRLQAIRQVASEDGRLPSISSLLNLVDKDSHIDGKLPLSARVSDTSIPTSYAFRPPYHGPHSSVQTYPPPLTPAVSQGSFSAPMAPTSREFPPRVGSEPIPSAYTSTVPTSSSYAPPPLQRKSSFEISQLRHHPYRRHAASPQDRRPETLRLASPHSKHPHSSKSPTHPYPSNMSSHSYPSLTMPPSISTSYQPPSPVASISPKYPYHDYKQEFSYPLKSPPGFQPPPTPIERLHHIPETNIQVKYFHERTGV